MPEPESHIEDPIRPLWPPDVEKRLRSLSGAEEFDENTMATFQGRMREDQEYRAKIWLQAKQLGEVIFDEESHSWGDWPDDPAECVGIGYVLGAMFDEDLNEALVEADEDKIAALEEFVRRGEGSVFDWFYGHLEKSKR